MKKIGVILCGQPRFIQYTWDFIKEEFNIPGYKTCFFGHLWDSVGYCVDDDIKNHYEPHQISTNIINDFTDLIIDNYQNLDNHIKLFQTKTKYIARIKQKNTDIARHQRYHFGQVYSKQEAYKLLQKWEKENNEKFDIIEVIKTDFLYRNKYCFLSEDIYNNTKFKKYNNLHYNSNIINVIGAHVIKYDSKEDVNNKNGNPIKFSYFSEKEKCLQLIKNNNHSIKLNINIHQFSCSGDVGEVILTKWFDLGEQLAQEARQYNNKNIFKRIRSMDGMYGELILRNNIQINKTYSLRNPIRVIHHEKYKKFDIETIQKITNKVICNLQDKDIEQKRFQEKLLQLSK